jgi:hypothetical protein
MMEGTVFKQFQEMRESRVDAIIRVHVKIMSEKRWDRTEIRDVIPAQFAGKADAYLSGGSAADVRRVQCRCSNGRVHMGWDASGWDIS